MIPVLTFFIFIYRFIPFRVIPDIQIMAVKIPFVRAFNEKSMAVPFNGRHRIVGNVFLNTK